MTKHLYSARAGGTGTPGATEGYLAETRMAVGGHLQEDCPGDKLEDELEARQLRRDHSDNPGDNGGPAMGRLCWHACCAMPSGCG